MNNNDNNESINYNNESIKGVKFKQFFKRMKEILETGMYEQILINFRYFSRKNLLIITSNFS